MLATILLSMAFIIQLVGPIVLYMLQVKDDGLGKVGIVKD
jgi:hypothetical protein